MITPDDMAWLVDSVKKRYPLGMDHLWLREGYVDSPSLIREFPALVTGVTLGGFTKAHIIVGHTIESEVAGRGFIPLQKIIRVEPNCKMRCEIINSSRLAIEPYWILHVLMFIPHGDLVCQFVVPDEEAQKE